MSGTFGLIASLWFAANGFAWHFAALRKQMLSKRGRMAGLGFGLAGGLVAGAAFIGAGWGLVAAGWLVWTVLLTLPFALELVLRPPIGAPHRMDGWVFAGACAALAAADWGGLLLLAPAPWAVPALLTTYLGGTRIWQAFPWSLRPHAADWLWGIGAGAVLGLALRAVGAAPSGFGLTAAAAGALMTAPAGWMLPELWKSKISGGWSAAAHWALAAVCLGLSAQLYFSANLGPAAICGALLALPAAAGRRPAALMLAWASAAAVWTLT